MANPNPMGSLFLLLLVILSVWAIFGAKGAKWKLLNLLIIIAFIGAGLGIGYLAGLWSGNMELGVLIGMPLAYLLGSAAAYICLRRNTLRNAALSPPDRSR